MDPRRPDRPMDREAPCVADCSLAHPDVGGMTRVFAPGPWFDRGASHERMDEIFPGKSRDAVAALPLGPSTRSQTLEQLTTGKPFARGTNLFSR